MPVIRIDGLMAPKKAYQELFKDLKFRVAQIQGLGVTREQVSPYVNPHIIQEEAGGGVFVYLEGLFDKPGRTPAVRQELVDAVFDVIYVFVKTKKLRLIKFIEVIPYRIDPKENGYRNGEVEWD